MGEMLIDSMRGEIPTVIIRPSVIESTYREPFPGWMEGNRYKIFTLDYSSIKQIAITSIVSVYASKLSFAFRPG